MMLLAILLLHPTLDSDGSLRMVATGVEDEEVTWSLDGIELGKTIDREALVIQTTAGHHELAARSEASTRWTVVARPEAATEGAAYVTSWSATHEAEPAALSHNWRVPRLPILLGGLAAILLIVPGRRGLEAGRRRRRA